MRSGNYVGFLDQYTHGGWLQPSYAAAAVFHQDRVRLVAAAAWTGPGALGRRAALFIYAPAPLTEDGRRASVKFAAWRNELLGP